MTGADATVGDLYEHGEDAWANGAELVYRPLAEALVATSPADLSGRSALDAGAGTGRGTGRCSPLVHARWRWIWPGRCSPTNGCAGLPPRWPICTTCRSVPDRRGGAGALRAQPRRAAGRGAATDGRVPRAGRRPAGVDLRGIGPPAGQGRHRRGGAGPRHGATCRLPVAGMRGRTTGRGRGLDGWRGEDRRPGRGRRHGRAHRRRHPRAGRAWSPTDSACPTSAGSSTRSTPGSATPWWPRRWPRWPPPTTVRRWPPRVVFLAGTRRLRRTHGWATGTVPPWRASKSRTT